HHRPGKPRQRQPDKPPAVYEGGARSRQNHRRNAATTFTDDQPRDLLEGLQRLHADRRIRAVAAGRAAARRNGRRATAVADGSAAGANARHSSRDATAARTWPKARRSNAKEAESNVGAEWRAWKD